MSVEHFDTLIAQLEGLRDDQFDMSVYMNDCGTVGCIAGWCAMKNGGPRRRAGENPDSFYQRVFNFAQDFLDLTDDAAINLFTPNGWQANHDRGVNPWYGNWKITRAEAIQRLKDMRDAASLANG